MLLFLVRRFIDEHGSRPIQDYAYDLVADQVIIRPSYAKARFN